MTRILKILDYTKKIIDKYLDYQYKIVDRWES